MIWNISPRIIIAVVAVVLAGAFVVWLRNDAARDERDRIERDALENRIETIEDAKRRRDDVEELPDDDLLRRLSDRVRGDND